MQAIIMAGGKGTRLRPYTNILPKPLLPVGNKSILDINIRQLALSGIDNIIIAAGYLGELIETVIGNGDKYGVKITYSYEDKPLGTVGGLGLIKNFLEDHFIVMNGDILHDLDFKILFNHHTSHSKHVTITTYKQLHKVSLGVLEIKNNNVINYIEKPTNEYLVSLGIYVIDKLVIEMFVQEGEYLDFPTLINKMIEDRKKISSFIHKGLWIDIGTTEEYLNLIENLNKIREENKDIPISI